PAPFPARAFCWPAAETGGAAPVDVDVAGAAPGDVFAFSPAAFIPLLCCPAGCFGVALAAGSPETLVSVLAAAGDFGVDSGLCAFDGAPSFVAPCGFAAVAPGFCSGACVFSGPSFFPFGVWSGCCAIAAPASASEQPISKLVNFFILV